MTRATFNVLYFVKHTKRLKDGTLPIFVRITLNSSRVEFGLQRSVEDEQWDTVKGKAKGNSKQTKEVNAYMETVRTNLHIKKRELEEQGKIITAESLWKAYLGLDEKFHYLIEIFKEHNEKCKMLENIDFAPGTVEKYENCLKHISNFILTTRGKKDILVSEVNPKFIKDFEFYLKTVRRCCHNTTVKYIKNFKKIIRIALANGWLKVDPFVNISYKFDEVDLDYLDEKELDRLITKRFSFERLQQVKDVYVFCCMTGLAFIDVKSLCAQDIITKENQLWIKKKRQKTKNWCHIPLLEPARQIIEKYKNHPECVKNNVLLPVLTNQKMNAYLKEIADLTGIEKNLSTHTARHTFATTVTLGNHVSMEVVSKMLGHSSVNMTKKYARVVDDLIRKDMQKIHEKFDMALVSVN
jgi:site-specific recombinase XerD